MRERESNFSNKFWFIFVVYFKLLISVYKTILKMKRIKESESTFHVWTIT